MEIKIIKFIQSYNSNILDVIMWLFSFIGGAFGIFLLFYFIYFKNKKYSVYFMFCILFNLILNNLLKILINKKRPYLIDKNIINKSNSFSYSFPSSHIICATTIVCFMFFAFIKNSKSKTTKILFYCFSIVFILGVMISRMYFGQHFLSDLIFGFFLAIFLSLVENQYYNLHAKHTKKRPKYKKF